MKIALAHSQFNRIQKVAVGELNFTLLRDFLIF
jgi:hypothetical protein